MQQPRAVVIGDALIDEIHDQAGVRELVGGAALNVAVGLGRLGIDTALIAMVGDDEAGDHIRSYLGDYGVRLIASAAPHGSSRATVRKAANGEPTYAFNDAAQQRTIRYDTEARDAIREAGLVAVSCFPFDRSDETEALIDALGGARVAIDPNPRAGMLSDRAEFVRGFERVAQRSVLVKIGADDAALLYNTDATALRDRLRALGVPAVLATEGADGATVETDLGLVRAPIADLPGRIVDTVGAGDATLASLTVDMLTGTPDALDRWQTVLDRAMGIAAATCRSEGGLLRTPESSGGMDLDRLGT